MKSRADVVVIGGGVMGCSILFHLARRGITNALLVEKESLGAGSTGRSSGIVRMHYSSEVNARIAFASLETIRDFQEIVGSDSGFVNSGAMFIAPPEAQEDFRRNIAMQQSLGIDTRVLDARQAKEVAPHLHFNESDTICFEPQSGYADPPSVGQGFASAARGMGAKVLLDTPALDVEIVNDRVVAVETKEGRVETDTAVVAAGPWSVQVMRKIGMDLPLKATRHEVFFLKRRMEVIPEHPVIGDLVNMAYMRPESPDLTLVGDVELEIDADPDDYDQKPSMDYIERMWGRVAKRAPGLEDAEYFTGYAGLYTNTPDGHPIIDKVEGVQGLYICTGFNGHGFKESPAVGKLVAEMIVDGEATSIDITSLGMARFGEDALHNVGYASKVMG